MHEQKIIDFDNGWGLIQEGITKFKNILEGQTETQFSSEDYMQLYSLIPNQQVHVAKVLPPLQEKHDEFMLRELVHRWTNYNVMVRGLSRFFHYLDKYFTVRRSLPALNEVALTCFSDLVYQELKVELRDAVISLINQEDEGEQIDGTLLENVLDILVEMGM